MKNSLYLSFFVYCICFQFSQSQDETIYDREMLQLATKVANRVKENTKLNVAVWFFHDTKGKRTDLGDYVGRDFSVHFTNVSKGFQVFDRDQMEQLASEEAWQTEGFINPATAKKINMKTAADAIVTGTVDYTLRTLRFRLKIIDTESGKQLAAVIGNVRPDEALKYILDDYFKDNTKHVDKNKRRLKRGERYGSPEYVDANCEALNIGDYCFENNTSKNYKVTLYIKSNPDSPLTQAFRVLDIVPGQSACFTDLKVNTYNYEMVEYEKNKYRTLSGSNKFGQLKTERCKSIVYTISNN